MAASSYGEGITGGRAPSCKKEKNPPTVHFLSPEVGAVSSHPYEAEGLQAQLQVSGTGAHPSVDVSLHGPACCPYAHPPIGQALQCLPLWTFPTGRLCGIPVGTAFPPSTDTLPLIRLPLSAQPPSLAPSTAATHWIPPSSSWPRASGPCGSHLQPPWSP